MSPSTDASVHTESRVQLERLLSGAGLPARAVLRSVSLSPPQPAVAAPVHGEWYTTRDYMNSPHPDQFQYCTPNLFGCLC